MPGLSPRSFGSWCRGLAGEPLAADGAAEASQLLPWWTEAGAAGRQGLHFTRVRLGDGTVAQELQRARGRPDWRLRLLPRSGDFAAAGADGAGSAECAWQLRPPYLLRATLLTGSCDEQDYWRRVLAEPPAPLPGAAVVLLLGAGRAALGTLRADWAGRGAREEALKEHKVITTYAVRGGEKQGTGRFQLFEDARKGHTGNSEGAALRRRCAIRFFEKVNGKLTEWREEARGEGWPPFVVFFAGDPRLRRLLLDCKKPTNPLPAEQQRWIRLPGPHAGAVPSLEALERAARALCTGETVERMAPACRASPGSGE